MRKLLLLSVALLLAAPQARAQQASYTVVFPGIQPGQVLPAGQNITDFASGIKVSLVTTDIGPTGTTYTYRGLSAARFTVQLTTGTNQPIVVYVGARIAPAGQTEANGINGRWDRAAGAWDFVSPLNVGIDPSWPAPQQGWVANWPKAVTVK